MAAKKMSKMDKNDDWMTQATIKAWVLVILGLLGLLQATGYVAMPWYFAYVWAVLVLILGVKKLLYIRSCK